MSNELWYIGNVSGTGLCIGNPSLVLTKGKCSLEAFTMDAIRQSREFSIFLAKKMIVLVSPEDALDWDGKTASVPKVATPANMVVDEEKGTTSSKDPDVVKTQTDAHTTITQVKKRDIVDLAVAVSNDQRDSIIETQNASLEKSLSKAGQELVAAMETHEKAKVEKETKAHVVKESAAKKLMKKKMKKSALCEQLLGQQFHEKKAYLDTNADVALLTELYFFEEDVNIKAICASKYKALTNGKEIA